MIKSRTVSHSATLSWFLKTGDFGSCSAAMVEQILEAHVEAQKEAKRLGCEAVLRVFNGNSVVGIEQGR